LEQLDQKRVCSCICDCLDLPGTRRTEPRFWMAG